jgi:hypothetical protein
MKYLVIALTLALAACEGQSPTPVYSNATDPMHDSEAHYPRDRCGELVKPGTVGTPRNQPCK